jgi:two-component system sensor histidine kinase CpxA
MRSLYLRIFIWFWVAMVAVAVLLIVSSPYFTRSRPSLTRWQRAAERMLEDRVSDVARDVAAGGPETPPGERRREHHRVPVFVLSTGGVAVAGPEPPEEVVSFARRVSAADEEVSERAGTLYLLGRPVTAPGGRSYVVIAAARRPPQLIDLLEPHELGWRLGIMTVVVGVLCFLLARQLSAPVGALQGVVRRLAGGDLAARVDPRIGERRDEIGKLAGDFNAMAARLEALVGAQRRLVRDVSHELRSPLTRLRLALELARRRSGEGAGEALSRIEQEAERLDQLIEQLLTLSRLEVAETAAEHEIVDLGELVAEVAEDARFEGSERGVAVVVDAPEGCTVTGDPEALRSAVENVLRNAIRHTGAGTEVTVRVARAGKMAEVDVGDRGPGVPEASLTELFEPFFRVEEARDRDHGGAGLGLTITARAVRLHGGRVVARNRDGGGLEVVILLPLARASS